MIDAYFEAEAAKWGGGTSKKRKGTAADLLQIAGGRIRRRTQSTVEP